MADLKALGPWNKGLNLTSNRDLSVFLQPNELGEATNITYTIEGFIQPRPGCKQFIAQAGTGNIYEHIGPPEVFSIVGYVPVGDQGIYSIVQVSGGNNTYLYKVRDVNDITLIHTRNDGAKYTHLIINSNFDADVITPPPAGITAPNYVYKKDTGVILFTNIQNVVSIAPLDLNTASTPIYDYGTEYLVPASHRGMVIKNRLFLFDYIKNRMYWSPGNYILDFRTTLEWSNFGDDKSGYEPIEKTFNKDYIRGVEYYNNNFYIFKINKTYMFTYQTSPSVDGYMRKSSDTTGALASTLYKEKPVVVNNKGVFRVEGTEFIDLQPQLNLRFEIPLDLPIIDSNNIFITNFNEDILLGFNTPTKTYYYCMNGNNGAWSLWDFSYNSDETIVSPGSTSDKTIASPGSTFVLCQGKNNELVKMLFTDFTKKKLVYFDWKPSRSLPFYHFDGNLDSTSSHNYYYNPPVGIKTQAAIGNSMLKFKKLYKYYTRFYLSEIPVTDTTQPPIWTLSINYNNYTFNSTNNPIFGLYPNTELEVNPQAQIGTAVYKRVYQIIIGQQRAKEFVFELKRRFTEVPSDFDFYNTDDDRPIKSGYYFLLQAIWFYYTDRADI